VPPLAVAAHVVSITQSLQSLLAHSEAYQERLAEFESAYATLEAQVSEHRARITEAHERADSASASLRHAEETRAKLASEVARLEGRLVDFESDHAAILNLRLAHTTLQQEHDRLVAAIATETEEKRVLGAQLDQMRAFEAENTLLQQRLQQAERRTAIVGADQQLNVQVTRRVLVELCEVLHACKLPNSSQSPRTSHTTGMGFSLQLCFAVVPNTQTFA